MAPVVLAVSRLILAFALLIGAAIGIGAYTFVYARGASYLTNDPKACVNCHVMREQFDGWIASSHHGVAVCNDCHAPHDLAGKYAIKALNGFRHSVAFTTGRFPEPIRITALNRRVTEETCRYCHADIVQAIDPTPGHSGRLDCIACHRSVGHLH
jgi:cytochrome c nitrite reductase small subunit